MAKCDIKTAFLYGDLAKPVFMEIPDGYTMLDKENKVCKLHKALYGLKQAPMHWNRRFTDFLKNVGVTPLKTEQCVFKSQNNSLILAIYVDDGLIIGKDKKEIENFLEKLNREFKTSVAKDVQQFLGINIQRNEKFIMLNQKNTAEQILVNFNMEECHGTKVPMNKTDKNRHESEVERNFPYREAVGSLLYMNNKTRPDLSFAVNFASRHVQEPTRDDVNIIKHILKYLKANPALGIKFDVGSVSEESQQPGHLTAFSDSDYAEDVEDRRSTTGYVIFFNNGPIAWSTRKQSIVALSTAEAEYIAAAECCRELLFLKTVLEEINEEDVSAVLKVDNKSAINLAKNGIMNRKSKHIDVRYHYITEKVAEGQLQIEYCNTNDQIADLFTKPLDWKKFQHFRKQIMYLY